MSLEVWTCPGCGARVLVSPCRFCGTPQPGPGDAGVAEEAPNLAAPAAPLEPTAQLPTGLAEELFSAAPAPPAPAPPVPAPAGPPPPQAATYPPAGPAAYPPPVAVPAARPGWVSQRLETRWWWAVAFAGLLALGIVAGVALVALADRTPPGPAPAPAASRSATTTPSTGPAAGSYLLVLASLPKGTTSRAEAQGRADALAVAGHTPAVLDSDSVPGLHGGYWAIAETGFADEAAALAGCATYGREPGGSCYARKVG